MTTASTIRFPQGHPTLRAQQPLGTLLPARDESTAGLEAPCHAAVAAVGITAAIDVLGSCTVRDAGAALRWLVQTSRRRGTLVSPSGLGWGRGSSPTLTAVRLSALGPLLKLNDQLRYRTAADRPSRPAAANSATDRRHHIPTMLWTTWAVRLQPHGIGHLRTLRLALSTMLLLPGSRHSLPAAAHTLGAIADPRETPRVLQALHAERCWPQILTALTRLTDYLDAHGAPIDYHRRRQLDYSDLLPDQEWRHICRQTGFEPGLRTRARLARCLLFEKISAIPADQAPKSFATNSSEARSLLITLATQTTPALASHLANAAEQFLRQHGIHDEPVEWQPPLSLLSGLILPGGEPDLVDLAALHALVRDGCSLTTVARRLGTSFNIIRHLLEQHPRPSHTPSQDHTSGHVRFARSGLPKELLIRLYCDERLSLLDIGRRVGTSKATVGRLAHEYGIPLRRHRPPDVVISCDWLYEQYVIGKRTLLELADETGISATTMIRWANKHQTPLRPRGGPSLKQSRIALAQAATAPRLLRPVLSRNGGWDRLRCFAAVADYPTLAIAARVLDLHPPFVSLQISQLEQTIGGQLLVRAQRGHPMQVTPLGRKVIAAARKWNPEEMPSI